MEPRAQTVLDRIYLDDASQRAANLPSSQRTRNVTKESGRFLSLVAKSIGAQTVFEIGSSNGASTIWLADAMRDTGGRVIGTEVLPDRATEANANLAAAGLASEGQILAGDARELVTKIPGRFDLIFIDAEKDDYIAHFEAVIERLRPGGVILADNVTSHDLSGYQAMLRTRSDVETVTVTIERGIEYTVKRRS
ncbi:MAG: O-methyltransferase [Thermomicrobiales bacterium]